MCIIDFNCIRVHNGLLFYRFKLYKKIRKKENRRRRKMDENNDNNGSGSTQLADPRPQLDTPLRVLVN